MEVAQTTPPEAHQTLSRDPDAVYLDVRTEEEFEEGHPAGARNVPIFFFDAATGRPKPNPDFVRVVEGNLPRSTKLFVGCQSGMRSQRACEVLLQAGYSDVTNVQGSFSGLRDPGGRVVVVGWRDAGLPVETGQPSEGSYATLKARS